MQENLATTLSFKSCAAVVINSIKNLRACNHHRCYWDDAVIYSEILKDYRVKDVYVQWNDLRRPQSNQTGSNDKDPCIDSRPHRTALTMTITSPRCNSAFSAATMRCYNESSCRRLATMEYKKTCPNDLRKKIDGYELPRTWFESILGDYIIVKHFPVHLFCKKISLHFDSK